MKKPTHGGKRIGSGRPPKDYTTVTVSFRVRSEWADIVRQSVNRLIKRLERNATP